MSFSSELWKNCLQEFEVSEGNGTPLQYFAQKIPWMEEPGRLQSMGLLRVGHNWATSLSLSCIGEGNSNPLQCSCLENPRDRGAWWLLSMGSHRVGHDWSDLAAAAFYKARLKDMLSTQENKRKLFCLDKTVGQLSSLHHNNVHKNHLNWKMN